MTHPTTILIRAVGPILLLSSTALHAEYFGLPNARLATLEQQSPVSVEVGFVSGDFGSADYEHKGLRLNYLLSETVMLFGDLGQSSVGNEDETAFGAGAFLAVGRVVPWANLALKGSMHKVDFDKRSVTSGGQTCVDNGGPILTDPFTGAIIPNPVPEICSGGGSTTQVFGGDVTTFSMEALLSGQPGSFALNPDLNWYVNAGVHSFDGNRSSDTEIGLGAGLVLPIASGELYGGVDSIDEITVAIGYRHNIN